MLDDIVTVLRCPMCGVGLVQRQGSLICESGHVFDIARQGYVSLLSGTAGVGTADTAEMVAARARVLGSGAYRPLLDGVAAVVAMALARPGRDCERPPVIVDAGAGSGEYLAGALARDPHVLGVALDLSKHAMRRAARIHPRIGAVVCDVWRGLPLRDGVASVLMNVFAPRNAAEFARVLAADGLLIVVTPLAGHLAELVGAVGMIGVDERKEERLKRTLGGHFVQVDAREVVSSCTLGHDLLVDVVRMGPSARHIDADEVRRRVEALPAPMAVTLAASISVWRRASSAQAGPALPYSL